MKKIVFSGVRPTGKLHLGNYFGLVKKALALQEEAECIFGIMDLHGITTPYDHTKYSEAAVAVALDYIAAGLDPEKSIIMLQSQVPEHVELAYILGTLMPLGPLQRIPTFKEKMKLHPDYVNLGMLSYPVLMAADIMVYKANTVPVGDDQLPHIELANELVRKFNNTFGDTFPKIEAILGNEEARILSLQNPKEKMSKTGGAGISLNDAPEEIREKIMKAVTDTGPTEKVTMSPGVKNLFILLSLFSTPAVVDSFSAAYHNGHLKYVDLKQELATHIIDALAPFRAKRQELSSDKNAIIEILRDGSHRARKRAACTISEVKEKMGFLQ